jgi:hypothetical protein
MFLLGLILRDLAGIGSAPQVDLHRYDIRHILQLIYNFVHLGGLAKFITVALKKQPFLQFLSER